MYSTLFSEKKIGSVTIPNRIVMTAMGHHMSDPDGFAGDRVIKFYEARAKGGVGLIITECFTVDYAHGKGNFGQESADDDKYIPGLTREAEAVHAAGGKIMAQLYHPGRQGLAALNGVESMPTPSGVEGHPFPFPNPVHAMSIDEIHEIEAKFVSAAVRVKKAGFDGIEIHGAHGYLVEQFLSPWTNTRDDEYGGSTENRCRFGKEILEGVRAECGDDFAIVVRLSVDEYLQFAGLPGEGILLEEGVKIAQAFESYGADALDISCGVYDTMNVAWEPIGFDEGWKMSNVEAVKNAVKIPVIGVSVIRHPEYAEKVLAAGSCDFVGSARQFFADPEWGNKAKEGREDEIRRCISCMYCMETLMFADNPPGPNPEVCCAVNFEGGREGQYSEALMKKDGDGRAVAIIGSGPAGLQAAIVAAQRGFKPIVFEKNDRIGGQLLLASAPPKKDKILWLLDYQSAMLKKLGVEIRTGAAPSVDDLKAVDPYAVIYAAGSSPILPDAFKGDNVYSVVDVLTGAVDLAGKNVAVIGSGMTGIETAEYLADKGSKISIFEMADDIGPGLFFQNLIDIMGRLGPKEPQMFPKHKLVSIDGNKAVFETTDTNESKDFEFDAYIMSLGNAPSKCCLDDIKGAFPKTKIVGDASEVARIQHAVAEGYKAAFEL